MTVIFQTSYSLPGGDQPLTHARIAHANNWLSGGTVTASTTDSDYFESGPTSPLTYEKWKPTTLAATWEYDHGSAAACDYCCIGAHTMGTNGNTLQVQYWNGSSWSGVIAATAITTDEPIMCIFAPQTRQRWRISISSGTVPEVGVIKFRQRLANAAPDLRRSYARFNGTTDNPAEQQFRHWRVSWPDKAADVSQHGPPVAAPYCGVGAGKLARLPDCD